MKLSRAGGAGLQSDTTEATCQGSCFLCFRSGRWEMRRPPLGLRRSRIHYLELQSAIKRNKLLKHAASWMNFKTALMGRSQGQETTYCMILYV